MLPAVKDFYRRTLPPLGRLGNGDIRLMFPLSIPAPITSVFGWRMHPISGDPRFHMGTDLGAPLGTPVLAAYAGRVVIADFLGGYGLAIALDHNKGTQQTLYGHLSEIFVKQGEWVKQGSVIGRVGSTGNSTGAHLHFEFRQLTPDGWVALDPGSQLEYALAELVKVLAVSEKGIAIAKGIPVSRQGQVGASGEISWNEP
jgi:murein DD-endopeptidase MepM/ murein hydrolase activator NlpD